jgi:ABC-2 type transport system permease protein
MRTSLRVFFIGGMMSYRALFTWLSPWILIPTFIVGPIFQILFFSYVGRAAGVGNDSFFLIGNAVEYAAIPCLFAMGNSIDGERYSQTLGLLLVSPARRIPLFLGRAMPVIVNGFAVSLFALIVGALVLGVSLPISSLALLAFALAVSAFSCTGLGLFGASIALRVRQSSVLSNIIMGILLIFCGVNAPLSALPRWMSSVAHWMPLTHGIAAARKLAVGASFASVSGEVATEAAVGVMYLAFGLALLRFFESESRQNATLELA